MRLKTFHASSMAEAMRQVREALGDDAIIVSSRTENGGSVVRLTAAIDEDDHRDHTTKSSTAKPPPAKDDALFAKPSDDMPDAGEELIEILLRHGTPAAVTEHFLSIAAPMAGTEKYQEERLSAILSEALTFKPLPKKPSPRPIILVGLPGSGKTLAAAKLATQAVMANLKPAVITADTIRAGGTEQLEAFTRILKTELMTIEDPDALEDAIAAVPDADLFIIDTPGINPFDADDKALLAKLLSLPGCETILVMPGSGDPIEAAENANIFFEMGATSIMPTRLDISRRLGALLAAAQNTKMPLCDASASPKVTDPLIETNSNYLATLLLAGSPTEVSS